MIIVYWFKDDFQSILRSLRPANVCTTHSMEGESILLVTIHIPYLRSIFPTVCLIFTATIFFLSREVRKNKTKKHNGCWHEILNLPRVNTLFLCSVFLSCNFCLVYLMQTVAKCYICDMWRLTWIKKRNKLSRVHSTDWKSSFFHGVSDPRLPQTSNYDLKLDVCRSLLGR